MNQEPQYAALTPSAGRLDVMQHPLCPRLPTLDGAAIAIVTFSLPDPLIDTLAPALAQALRDRYSAQPVIRRKATPSMNDDPDLWHDLVATARAFVFVGSVMPSQTADAARWSFALERRGLPGAAVILDRLHANAAETCERLGMPVRLVGVNDRALAPHTAEFDALVADLTTALVAPLTSTELASGARHYEQPPRIAIRGSADEVSEHFYRSGWTDGLPIVIPTEQRLARMLAGTKHAPDTVVAPHFPPEGLCATVEKIAISGIMAGCLPEHLPVLLAACEAFAIEDNEPKLVSTNSFSFMLAVNGPARHAIEMNAGVNALGPGNRANATIGRALRLFIHNLGGGRPGKNIMATQGNVSGYTFCFAENEEASPWEPFHVSQGYQPGDSTITCFSGGWCHVGNYSFEGHEHLAETIAHFEHPEGVVILVSPEKAALFNARGFSKQQLEQAIWAAATLPLKRFKASSFYTSFVESNLRGVPWAGEHYLWPKEYLDLPDDAPVAVFPRRFVRVLVVGGAARDVMQAWRMARPNTVSIDKWR